MNPEEFEVEDFAMGTIRFEGGLTVTLETAWASHIENIGGTFFMGDVAGPPTNLFRFTWIRRRRW